MSSQTLLQQRLDKIESPFWIFDSKSNRYREKATGRFLSQQGLERLQQKHIALIGKDIETIGELLIRRQISLETFQEATAKSIKTLWLQQYALGRGGVNQVSSTEWLAVGRSIREQYGYLRGFAEDINRGYSIGKDGQPIPMSEAKFRARLKLYSKASRTSFEMGKQQVARSINRNFMWRTLGATDRHCSECLSYRAAGIRPIGSLPLPGQACSCRGNCLCTAHYSSTIEEALLRQGKTM